MFPGLGVSREMKDRENSDEIPADQEIDAVGKPFDQGSAHPTVHPRKAERVLDQSFENPIDFSDKGVAQATSFPFVPKGSFANIGFGLRTNREPKAQ